MSRNSHHGRDARPRLLIPLLAGLGSVAALSVHAASTTADAAAAKPAAQPMTHAEGHPHHDPMQLDTNKDGLVSREEAKAHEHLAAHFDVIDLNHDGHIDAGEFRQHHASMMGGEMMGGNKAERRAKAKERWKSTDRNKDGKLDLAEAQVGMPKLAENFSKVDGNNDGYVTPEEMREFHHKMQPH
jgi:hypothetical protein